MRLRSRFSCAVAALVAMAACHPSPVRLTPDTVIKPLDTLRREIDADLAQPLLARGYWGVLIKSLKSDETLYERNAGKLMMPASNMKIVTLAAAAEKLGWDYRYETAVFAAGPVSDGVLNGDLVVVGSGDPSLVAADGMADRLFGDWAERLNQRGLRTVSGRGIGADTGFGDRTPAFGGVWDALPGARAGGGLLQAGGCGAGATAAGWTSCRGAPAGRAVRARSRLARLPSRAGSPWTSRR